MRPPFAPSMPSPHEIVPVSRHGLVRCQECNQPICGAVSLDEGQWIGGVHQDDYDNGRFIERVIDEYDNTRSAAELLGKPLTFREVQVLQAAADIRPDPAALSVRLGCAPSTINNHLGHIRGKLGAKNTTHALAIALRTGLIR